MGSSIASQGWFLVVIFILIVMSVLGYISHRYRQENEEAAKKESETFCQHEVSIQKIERLSEYIKFRVQSTKDSTFGGVISFDKGHPNYKKLQSLEEGQVIQFLYRGNVYKGARPTFFGVYSPTDYIQLRVS